MIHPIVTTLRFLFIEMERFERNVEKQNEHLQALAEELNEFQSKLDDQVPDASEAHGVIRNTRNSKQLLCLKSLKRKSRYVNKHQINHWEEPVYNTKTKTYELRPAAPHAGDVPDDMQTNDEIIINDDESLSIAPTTQRMYAPM